MYGRGPGKSERLECVTCEGKGVGGWGSRSGGVGHVRGMVFALSHFDVHCLIAS